MFLHVHVVGTTGLHARERREYKYAPRCSQCGVAVDATQHVGAHVLTYPCFPFNQCCGTPSLKTTCRACNSRHRAEEAGECCPEKAAFLTCGSGARLERARCWPWCVVLSMAEGMPAAAKPTASDLSAV